MFSVGILVLGAMAQGSLAIDSVPVTTSLGDAAMMGGYGGPATPGSYEGNLCGGECVSIYGQCGGKDMDVKGCCDSNTVCLEKNEFYAQCLPMAAVAETIETKGWTGDVLECEDPVPPAEACGDDCVPTYGKCAGTDMLLATCCADPDAACVKKNDFYAQCLPAEKRASHIADRGWSGEELLCGEAIKADTMQMRRLQTTEPVAGAYGGYGSDGCMYVDQFDQCGGIDFPETLACSNEFDKCVKKNDFYAQCVPAYIAERNAQRGWDGQVLPCGVPMAM